MRRLAVSLLLLVALATLAAGWTLDRLYADAAAAAEPLSEWRRLGRSLADAIATGGKRTLPPDASLLDRVALPLDQDPDGLLARALAGPTGLALESDAGVTVHYSVDDERVLALRYRPAAAVPVAPRLIATLGFYLALLLLVLIGLLPLFRRLRRLVRATTEFGRGVLSTRVPTGAHSELHPLERGFNGMADRIERLIEDNRLLGQGVAHDVRTPLARLRFGIDALAERLELAPGEAPVTQQSSGRSRALEQDIEHLQADLDAMEHQLEALLDYARLESRVGADLRDTLSLDRLVREAVDGLPGPVDWDPPPEPARVLGHEAQLRMLIANLLQNAQRHGAGAVRVRLTAGPAEVQLRVEDDGPGIQPGERERLLKPFQRGASSGAAPEQGQPHGAGHGLGLALIDRIAVRHGGELRIGASQELGGARFEVVLPPLPGHAR